MSNMKKRFLLIGLLSMSGFVWGEELAPPSCQPLPVRGDMVSLSTKKPIVLLIHNISDKDLWVTHPIADPGASAGWTSRLDAGKWSAFVLTKSSFDLTCVESSPGHEQQAPCEGLLAICQWPQVKIPGAAPTTAWAGENRGFPDLMSYLGGNGFSLPPLGNQ